MISPDMSVIHLITYLHPARDKLLDKLIERLYQQDARQTILVRFDAWEMRVAIPDKREEGNRTGKELLWQYFFYPKISGSFIANSTNQVVTNIVSLRCPTQGSPATPAAGQRTSRGLGCLIWEVYNGALPAIENLDITLRQAYNESVMEVDREFKVLYQNFSLKKCVFYYSRLPMILELQLISD